jgi:hypothetical protein
MIKQIVLQLDEDRYKVLVKALTYMSEIESEIAWQEKERVMAEQLKGLVITQWTGSREEVKSNIMPISDTGWQKGKIKNTLQGWTDIIVKPVLDPGIGEHSEKEKKVLNYHSFEPSTNFDGTPNYKKCAICHKGQKARVHSYGN